MSSSAISALKTDYLQIAISSTSAYQGSAVANTSNSNYSSLSGLAATYSQGSDSGQLSPFAQLVSTLQQIQQSNPAEYQKLTTQIATNLQTAASSAQSGGDSSQASQLSQLATDFTKASSSGQLPNLQDLAQAVGGSQHQSGAVSGSQSQSFSESILFASSSSVSSSNATASTAASASTASTTAADSTTGSSSASSSSEVGPLTQLKKLLASFLASVSQDQSQTNNPLSIIQNALSNAGFSYSNG